MPKILLVLSLVFSLTACTHQRMGREDSAQREPSSNDAKEISVEALLSANDPRAEAMAYVGRLLRIRLRASAWIAEVDQAFNEAGEQYLDLFTVPSYRRLLVARPLVERMEHKIAEIYQETRAISLGNQKDRSDRALLALAGFRDSLLEARRDPVQRVLLHDLMVTLRDSFRKKQQPPVQPLSDQELAAAAAEAAPQIESLVRALPRSDDAVIEVENELGQSEFSDEANSGRNPNAANVFPSAGPNGNIDGSTFPAGTWALTLDDGPHGTHTERGLAVLKKHGIKATYFWLAKMVKANSRVVAPVKAAGMALENHSWNHAQLDSPRTLARMKTTLNREINESTAFEAQAYGAKPKYFRNPYGAGFRNTQIRTMIANQGMVHVRWNVDSEDWHDKNPSSVLARVLQQMNNVKRGIILFHDVQPHTPGILDSLLQQRKSSGRWLTIPAVVDQLNGAQ